MVNFIPFKKYIFKCIDNAIQECEIKPPFLDAGCGKGDLSKHLALKDWYGESVDESNIAITNTQNLLINLPQITVKKKSIFEINSNFKSIFLLDVLEHIKEDEKVLKKLYSLLDDNGHLIIIVPSNPREWRWDDEFYGHYRRYTATNLENMLKQYNFEPIIVWDITFPFFWLMRRIYTRVINNSVVEEKKSDRTDVSSVSNAWNIPILPNLVSHGQIIWKLIYKLQFTYFKNKVEKGHELLVVAKKSKRTNTPADSKN